MRASHAAAAAGGGEAWLPDTAPLHAGQLPSSWGQTMPKMQRLRLDNASIQGSLPPEWGLDDAFPVYAAAAVAAAAADTPIAASEAHACMPVQHW